MAYVEEKLSSRKILFQHTDADMVLSVAAAILAVSLFVAFALMIICPTSYVGVGILMAAPALFILTVIVFLIVLTVKESIEKEEN